LFFILLDLNLRWIVYKFEMAPGSFS